jgi:CS domain
MIMITFPRRNGNFATKKIEHANQLNKLARFLIFDPSVSFNIVCPALPYTWRQELGEVDVVVPVSKGTRAKDLQVILQKKNLSVGLKGQDKILDGVLCKDIKVEDSTWSLRASFLLDLMPGSSHSYSRR